MDENPKLAPQRYLVTSEFIEPFTTNYFDPENHFNSDIGMIVYDCLQAKYTTDGKVWHDIQQDHL